MKKWCFLITILLVFSMLSIFVSAETSTIKQGTPVIDGALDDAYASSLMLEIGTGENAYGDTGCYAWEGATAKVYFLYDDKYVYICAVVKDNDVLAAPEDYVLTNSNPTDNDVLEFRHSFDGGITVDKVGIDAFGVRAYSMNHTYSEDLIQYETKILDDGYVVECGLPWKEANFDLMAEGRFGFKIQFNDLTPNENNKILYFAPDYEGEGPKGLVYYKLDGVEVPTDTETTDTETPETSETTVPVETTEDTTDHVDTTNEITDTANTTNAPGQTNADSSDNVGDTSTLPVWPIIVAVVLVGGAVLVFCLKKAKKL